MDILEAMSKRISVRTYESRPATGDDLEEVRCAGVRAETLTQNEMQFHLCTDAHMGKEVKGICGKSSGL